jgi:formamidopyrimidine-DNA glycosylase
LPELPEVETIRKGLVASLVGREVRRIRITLPRLLEVGRPEELTSLEGQHIQALRRHGKYLLVDFTTPATEGEAQTLVIHLGMTGQLTFRPRNTPPADHFVRLVSGLQRPVGAHSIDKHTHLVVELDSGDLLLFRDPRTFGKLLLLPQNKAHNTPRLARLGPDALGLPPETFLERFWVRRGKRVLKSLLLDQSLLAGVGNIYADEACFEAGLRPQRRSQRTTRAQVRRLADCVQAALQRGLANCGTSFSDYVGPDGHPGSNQEDLRVYGRGGLPCIACGEKLEKGVVAQRGTVWCPHCQK